MTQDVCSGRTSFALSTGVFIIQETIKVSDPLIKPWNIWCFTFQVLDIIPHLATCWALTPPFIYYRCSYFSVLWCAFPVAEKTSRSHWTHIPDIAKRNMSSCGSQKKYWIQAHHQTIPKEPKTNQILEFWFSNSTKAQELQWTQWNRNWRCLKNFSAIKWIRGWAEQPGKQKFRL